MASPAQPTPSWTNLTLADRTVLLIEDHKDSRDLLTTVLRSLRAHVVAVANIEQAERRLQFARPDLIVCDLKLPDGTGLDFIKWLRLQRLGRDVPAMAITGWADQFPEELAAGFDAYMQKPIDLDRFCTTAVSLGRR